MIYSSVIIKYADETILQRYRLDNVLSSVTLSEFTAVKLGLIERLHQKGIT